MYRSAEKSGILDYMTFVQNGVDEVRRKASMNIDNSNNGGSFVELGHEIIVPNPNIRKFAMIYFYDLIFLFLLHKYVSLALNIFKL